MPDIDRYPNVSYDYRITLSESRIFIEHYFEKVVLIHLETLLILT